MEPMPASNSGVTMIELLIVLSLIGLLAVLAYPNYQSHVTGAQRAQAQIALLALANAMERHYAFSGDYAGAGSEADAQGVANAVGSPTVFPAHIPMDGERKVYELRIITADRYGYLLQAIPVADGPQGGDGLLQLDHSGARGWDRDGDGLISPAEGCWASSC